MRLPRRAELDREAVVDRDRRKYGIPDRATLVATDDHGLRIVEDDTERHAARCIEAGKQAPDQRLDPFVRDHLHVYPSRVLEPVGGEVDDAPASVGQAHTHLAKVELGILPRDPFEADEERGRNGRSHSGEQAIHRAQAKWSALLAQQTGDLTRRPFRVLEQQCPNPRPHRVIDARAAHGGLGRRFPDRRFAPDSLNGPARYSKLFGHGPRRETRPQQLLHCMSIQHPEHPPLPPVIGTPHPTADASTK